jgi:hypothetical protein
LQLPDFYADIYDEPSSSGNKLLKLNAVRIARQKSLMSSTFFGSCSIQFLEFAALVPKEAINLALIFLIAWIFLQSLLSELGLCLQREIALTLEQM